MCTSRGTLVAIVVGLCSSSSGSWAMSTSTPRPGLQQPSFAVVGVGVLGTSLCRQLLDAYPDSVVTGITKTTHNHASIRETVMERELTMSSTNAGAAVTGDRLRLVTCEQDLSAKFDNVVFCAPPSGFDDYPAAVQDAIDRYWQGPSGSGIFVVTSSGAVYVHLCTRPGNTSTSRRPVSSRDNDCMSTVSSHSRKLLSLCVGTDMGQEIPM
jgi:hypothetical protein